MELDLLLEDEVVTGLRTPAAVVCERSTSPKNIFELSRSEYDDAAAAIPILTYSLSFCHGLAGTQMMSPGISVKFGC